MASMLFKRLFEVRLLHEYYLMQADGTSLFDKKRTEWPNGLAEKVINRQYNVANDLLIEPTESCKKQLTDYHIRFAVKPTGFILGIEVNFDQVTPRIPLKEPVLFQFSIRTKNPQFRSFTSESASNTGYYFSNRPLQLKRMRTAPTLSNTIANFTKEKTYAMGELARTSDKLQIARKTTNSDTALDWMPLSDQGDQYMYVNDQDTCRFAQKTIPYQATEPIKKLVAKLVADGSTEPVKTISLSFDTPVQIVSLNFLEDDKGNKITDGLYLLTVSYNENPEESKMIYFSDTLATLRPYALIEITTAKGEDFSVLTADNSIRKSHRIFDILIKSRATYWRYRSNNGKKLTKPDSYDFLTEKGLDLITVDPRLLSAEASYFQKTINSPTVFLPGPDAAISQQGDDVFYSNVFVPKV
ncbi:hypothetical protein [Spirosoma validum]|uniref:Uncharacterized protein n=1 Tax=Spirosoma validum TaxID=2771355 RepID=A0A927GD53_9BACT|nr:hypothetical protein [Spirosoma validum]MBD2753205.1 hypothetical protein [Spirosoma validum]